jgi:uncharacterized protein YdcH (DUF465 family)
MVTEEIREAFNNYLDTVEKLVSDNIRFKQALEEIKELNKHCADCEGNTCGVCAAADGKPNNSYRIANEALK